MAGSGASARRGERGVALVVALLAGLLLVALTAALVPLSTIETEVVMNHRRAVEGVYAAEAALALAAAELGARPDWTGVVSGAARSPRLWGASLAPTMPDGGTVDLAAVAGRLTTRGVGEDSAGRGLDWALYAHGPLGAWATGLPAAYGPWLVAVWVADDAADSDPILDGNGAVSVHAAAYGPRRATRALQATLVRQVVTPAPPASRIERVRVISWRVVQ